MANEYPPLQPNDAETPLVLPLPGGGLAGKELRIKRFAPSGNDVVIDYAATLRLDKAKRRLDRSKEFTDDQKTMLILKALIAPVEFADLVIAWTSIEGRQVVIHEAMKAYNANLELEGLQAWLKDGQGKDRTDDVWDVWMRLSGLRSDTPEGEEQKASDPTITETSSLTVGNSPQP
jgi:hypothetical protein